MERRTRARYATRLAQATDLGGPRVHSTRRRTARARLSDSGKGDGALTVLTNFTGFTTPSRWITLLSCFRVDILVATPGYCAVPEAVMIIIPITHGRVTSLVALLRGGIGRQGDKYFI